MGIFGKVKKGLIFVISAPAGTGKTTLVEMLINEFPQDVQRSVSCTTRLPRKTEQDGVDYIFLSKEEFERKIEEGAFLEYAQVFEHYYGTLKGTIFALQLTGKHVFLVIDTQGAMYLKDKIDAVFVFITPPNLNALRERLEKRHTESQEMIDLRLSHAKSEMEQACHYDYVLINDHLPQAYKDFKALIGKEEQKLCEYI